MYICIFLFSNFFLFTGKNKICHHTSRAPLLWSYLNLTANQWMSGRTFLFLSQFWVPRRIEPDLIKLELNWLHVCLVISYWYLVLIVSLFCLQFIINKITEKGKHDQYIPNFVLISAFADHHLFFMFISTLHLWITTHLLCSSLLSPILSFFHASKFPLTLFFICRYTDKIGTKSLRKVHL